jgi:hypothetical protein
MVLAVPARVGRAGAVLRGRETHRACRKKIFMQRLRSKKNSLWAGLGGLLAMAGLWGTGAPAQALTPKPVLPPKTCVLVVGNEKSPKMLALEDEAVDAVHSWSLDHGLSKKAMPVFVYHVNKSDESQYCEKRLGVDTGDVMFLGLARFHGLVVDKVLERMTDVGDTRHSIMKLMDEASGFTTRPPVGLHDLALALIEVPPTPFVPPPPPPEPPAQVVRAVMCDGYSQGEPIGVSQVFSEKRPFFLFIQVRQAHLGSVIQWLLYKDDKLWRYSDGEACSGKQVWRGDQDSGIVYWKLVPVGNWQTGRYQIRLLVDGQEQKTVDYEVRS